MKDIDEGKVSYLHNGKSVQQENLLLTLSDTTEIGYLFAENEYPITTPTSIKINILPVDGGTPIIATNTGLQLLHTWKDKVRSSCD